MSKGWVLVSDEALVPFRNAVGGSGCLRALDWRECEDFAGTEFLLEGDDIPVSPDVDEPKMSCAVFSDESDPTAPLKFKFDIVDKWHL